MKVVDDLDEKSGVQFSVEHDNIYFSSCFIYVFGSISLRFHYMSYTYCVTLVYLTRIEIHTSVVCICRYFSVLQASFE